MHARVVHFAGAGADLERGIAEYEEQVLPFLRETTGFRGQAFLLDRDAGRGLAITFWADEKALRGFEATAERFRELLTATWETQVTGLESYEVALLDVARR